MQIDGAGKNNNKLIPLNNAHTANLSSTQLLTQEVALSSLNVSASAQTTLSNPIRTSLIKGTVSLGISLAVLCDQPFMITLTDVSIDKSKHEKILSFIRSRSFETPLKNTQFVDVETSDYTAEDLKGLKYLALLHLKSGEKEFFYFFLTVMNKIDPLSPFTLTATVYGSVLSAYRNRNKISEARACINLAKRCCPDAKDIKMLSFALHKLEAPAEAVIEGLHLIKNKVLDNYNEITRFVRFNVHRSDFRIRFAELLKRDLEQFKSDNQLHSYCLLTVTEVLAFLLYFDGKYQDVENLIVKQSLRLNLTQPTLEIGVLALLKRGKLKEAEKLLTHVVESKYLLNSCILHQKNEEKNALASLAIYLKGSSHLVPIITFLEVCAVIFKNKVITQQDTIKRLEAILTVDMDCAGAMRLLLDAYLKQYEAESKPELKNKILKMSFLYETVEPINSLKYAHKLYELSLKIDDLKKDLSTDYPDKIYRKYKEFKKNDDQFVEDFGKLLEKDIRIEQALILYKEHHLTKGDDRSILKLSEYLYSLKRIDEAATHITGFFEQNPKSATSHYLVANHLNLMGRNKEALEYATNGLEIDPNRQDLKFVKAFIFFDLKEYALCVKQIERIKKTRRNENLFRLFLPRFFRCYLELNHLAKAGRLLEEYASFIPDTHKKYYDFKLAAHNEECKRIESEEKSLDTAPSLVVAEPSSTQAKEVIPVKIEVPPTNNTPVKPEPIRNIVKQGPCHLQSFSKHAVGSLNANDRVQAWVNNPSLLREACTIDPSIYPNTKPAAAPVTIETVEVVIAQKFNPYEANCLEIARQHLIAIGDLLQQEKEYVSSDPSIAANYLLPRTLVYHVLKFGEALTPTGRNQRLLSEVFEQTIQTHIISAKLVQYLRNIARHHFATLDMIKLKVFCWELVKTTVLHNIVAYINGELTKQKKITVKFAHRTNLPVEQTLTKEVKVDYLETALFELNEIHRVANKIGIHEIDASNLYKNGIKLAICAVEECLKRLGISHRELDEFFYFGNKVAHEMGEDPKNYVNEEIPLGRLNSIIIRKDRIIELIKTSPKKHFAKDGHT